VEVLPEECGLSRGRLRCGRRASTYRDRPSVDAGDLHWRRAQSGIDGCARVAVPVRCRRAKLVAFARRCSVAAARAARSVRSTSTSEASTCSKNSFEKWDRAPRADHDEGEIGVSADDGELAMAVFAAANQPSFHRDYLRQQSAGCSAHGPPADHAHHTSRSCADITSILSGRAVHPDVHVSGASRRCLTMMESRTLCSL